MKKAETAAADGKVVVRRADGRDAEVSRRIRARRLECGLTQSELANKIGVTFQQVQKYETGRNRIGAGRLQRLAEALVVPIPFFFDATPHAPTRVSGAGANSVFEFVQNASAVRLVKAFHRIKSAKLRQVLVQMAEQLAGGRPR
jgi:transcriptional regulator with XRE-family HTH domain